MADDIFISFGTSITDDSLRLFHGTDLCSANWIAEYGLSWERLSTVEGAFAFFATIDQKIASQYAAINPAMGTPAILGFGVPVVVMQEFLTSEPPGVIEYVEDKAYAFDPDTFSTMNYVMTNMTVQIVTDATINFDE